MAKQPDYTRLILFASLWIGLGLMVYTIPSPEPKLEPTPEIRPTPAVIPQPEPQPAPAVTPQPEPRDVRKTPTDILLKEWNAWRHCDAPRTKDVQATYEELLRRGMIRRDGEPVSDGGRRRIGRRR